MITIENQPEQTTGEAIMAAAEQEFLDKGYAAAKTTEIARRAGVTHAMLHYYYRTKENLFGMVFRRKVEALFSSFAVVVDGGLPFLEKVRAAVEAHFDFVGADPRLPMFILNEVLRNPRHLAMCQALIRPLLPGLLARIQDEIDAEAARGTIRRIEARDLLLDVASLNVFIFSARPLVQILVDADEDGFAEFLRRRKEENVRMILDRLKL